MIDTNLTWYLGGIDINGTDYKKYMLFTLSIRDSPKYMCIKVKLVLYLKESDMSLELIPY